MSNKIKLERKIKGGFMGVETGSNDEENAKWRIPKPEKPKLIIGAKENTDGTMDYSKAAARIMKPEEAKKFQEHAAEERRKAFEVPPGVKAGSTDMVKHGLDKRIFIAKDGLGRARATGDIKLIERRFTQLHQLQKEKGILDSDYVKRLQRGMRDDEGDYSAEYCSEILDGYIDSEENDKNPDKNELAAARELRTLLTEESLRVKE